MRICHVITRMIVGGAQENTLLTVLDHALKGHEVLLVTGPSPGPEGELLKGARTEGVEVVAVEPSELTSESSSSDGKPRFEMTVEPSLVRAIMPFHDLAAYSALRRIFGEWKPDVVHTHSSKAGVLGRAAAWKERVSFVCHTIHGPAFHNYEKPWRNALYKAAERWAAKRCHKMFSVADAMTRQYVAAGIAPESKFKTVYSGMRVEDYASAKPDSKLRSALGIPENAPVVVTVARLFPLKGYDHLLDAAETVSKELPETRFLIVGNGILRDEIEEEAKRRGVNFVFAGLVKPGEVGRYIALGDVMAHLSLREGWPRSVVQALAAGIPAVCFDLDGAPEVVLDGETGFVLPAGDALGVAEALLRLLGDADLRQRLGCRGAEIAVERFDWRRMGDILEAEYQNGMGAAD